MRRLMMLVALISAMSLLAPGAGMATASPVRPAAFGPAVKVLGGMLDWGLDMAVDSAGHVHLVAAGIHAGKPGLWYATDRSGSWATKRILRWSAGAVYVYPSLAIDANDRVHIAVDRYQCVECTVSAVKGIFYLSDVGRARGTFPATPTRLTAAGTAQGSLRVSGGHVFLAFAGNPDRAETAVRLLTNASGHWTTSTVVAAGTRPALRIGMDGTPHVLFTSGAILGYARAGTLTGQWHREPVTTTTGFDADPALSIDEDGGAHALWWDRSTGMDYGTRHPGGWSWVTVAGGAPVAALSIDKPDQPWIATAADQVEVFRLAGGILTSLVVDTHGARSVAIKVLDAGAVVVAFVGGATLGVWISRGSGG